jgi:hypothetical protein
MLLGLPLASAQNGAPPISTAPVLVQPQVQQSNPQQGDEVTIVRDDFAGKYNISTLENLSKLYWRLGAFDFEDNEAITNYIKINDCKIFTEYLNDDMEWNEIVGSMRQYLKTSRDSFPLNYQFVLELHLGRYDPQKKGFPIVDKTGFKDAKRIQVDSIDSNREICHDYKAIKDYPKSLIILLPEPFSLDFVPVDEHVAQAYILRKKAEYSQLEEALRIKRYERNAYLRMRVTFSQYHGNLRGDQAQVMAILFGKIDGYEIFEDSGQQRMMMSVDLNKQEKSSQMSMPQMSYPAPDPKNVINATAPATAFAP